MKYSIHIDQVASIEWGLNLPEAAIFSFLYSVSGWADPVVIGGEVWYFASRHKAIAEMPIVSDVPDTIYRQYKSLAEKGVIEWQKHLGMDCVRITAKGAAWNSEKNPRNSENFPKNSAELGKKSEKTRKKIRENSEKNPTYKYTIDKGTIDKREGGDLSLSNKKTETKNPTGQPIPPPPCPAAPPSPETFFAPDKHERAADEVIRYLEENRRYLNGMEAGDWHRAVRGHCLKLQSSGKWADLTIPGQDGLYFSWIGRRIAGAKSWFSAAAEIDKNGKNNRINVPNTPPKTWNPDVARNVFLRLCAEDGLIPGEEPGL